jgi:predicted Fe-Mo cluster-binding NifX family protein
LLLEAAKDEFGNLRGWVMKIIVTALAPDIDAPVDRRFGRAACFVAVDGETLAWEAHRNPAVDAAGGAGSRAAEFVAGLGPEAVISGAFGPNALGALDAAGIGMYLCPLACTARQALDDYLAGRLERAGATSRPGRHG